MTQGVRKEEEKERERTGAAWAFPLSLGDRSELDPGMPAHSRVPSSVSKISVVAKAVHARNVATQPSRAGRSRTRPRRARLAPPSFPPAGACTRLAA